MSVRRACGKRISLGGLPLSALAGVLAVAAGCGGPKAVLGPVYLEHTEYDHYFFVDPASGHDADGMGADALKEEVERLATPSWTIARDNLIAAGKAAIPILIANLDRTDPTHVSFRPVPGHVTPEPRETWTLGQVVGSILADLVAGYGNYDSATPLPSSKDDWEMWWRANRKKVVVYSPEGAVPPHVVKQKEALRAAMQKEYPGIDEAVAKMLEKRAARDRKLEEIRRENDEKRLKAAREAEAR